MFSQTIWPPVFRTLLVAAILILSFFALQYVLPLIYPFLLGWLFAWMMKPVVEGLTKSAKFPRWLAVTVALLIFVTLTLGIITFVASQLVVQIGQLLKIVESYMAEWQTWTNYWLEHPGVQGWYNQLYSFYDDLDPNTQTTIRDNVRNSLQSLASFGQRLVTGTLSGILIFLSSLPNIATVMVIALIASFFIALDWNKINRKIADSAPTQIRKSTGPILVDLKRALFGFLKAQLILISITAVIVIVGLLIMGVDYAFTIGLITGLVDLVPYLGTGAVLVPWIIYLLIMGSNKLALGLAILYGVIIVMRQILEPKVLASTVGLDPLLTLIALFVGLKLFGFLGLIIGPVTLVVLGALNRANVLRDIWLFIRDGIQRDTKAITDGNKK